MALTRTQWIPPAQSPEVLRSIFNNLDAFCFHTKIYSIQDGRKHSYSSYDCTNFVNRVSQYYWTYYSKGCDRLYTLVYLHTGEYVYCKTKGVTGWNGEQKKLRMYVSQNLNDLLDSALTKSEYERYMMNCSHV